MPPKSAAPGWLGAPPVARDGFAFSNGVFFADASGQNRHPRASIAELKAHFNSGNANDHPAHWFEAQLIHYDLKPSKTKATARMRLLDAVNAGDLAVPTRLIKLEGDLKKEWTKHDREAKKEANAAPVAGKQKATPAKAKGKAAGPATASSSSAAATKKSKAKPSTASTSTAAEKKSAAAKSKAKAAETAPAAKGKRKASEPATASGSSGGAVKKAKTTPSSAPPSATTAGPPARARQTARRGGIHQSPGRASAAQPAAPPVAARPTGNMARRSKPWVPRGRTPSPARGFYGEVGIGYDDDDDDDEDNDSDGDLGYSNRDDDIKSESELEDVKLGALGLLNGGYDIQSSVSDEWPHLGNNFSLILTLAGDEIWGQFDLGVVEGVFHMPERPWKSSYNPVPFTWRGREIEGPIMYGDHNHGWIKFLGDGRIQGELEFMEITFSGQRYPGQGTRSEVDAREMKNEWSEYSEARYDEENETRWR